MLQEFDDLTRSVIFGEDADAARGDFLDAYWAEIEQFIAAMAGSLDAWRRLSKKLSRDNQGANLSALIYNALHNHIISMKLFVEGHMVAAGNAERFTLEGIATAILASNHSLNVMQRYMEGKYSTNRAIRDLRRHAETLQVEESAVRQLEESARFYDQYSHPTMLTIASLATFDDGGPRMVFGSYFDEGKKFAYRKEVRSRVSLASVFPNLIQGVENHFFAAT